MRRRLRKKLHQREFNNKVFGVAGHFQQPVDEASGDAFMDGVISFAELRGYAVGGGQDPDGFGVLVSKVKTRRRKAALPGARTVDCTEHDRSVWIVWLSSQDGAEGIVGPLISAWNVRSTRRRG